MHELEMPDNADVIVHRAAAAWLSFFPLVFIILLFSNIMTKKAHSFFLGLIFNAAFFLHF